MARPPTNLLHVIRRLAGDCRGDARSDAELLAAFAHAKDERAFTALVARHGRLVWARCVNVLGKAGESHVDDCFQAVFIALARKAHAVAGASLPSWLAETARRTALEAQRRDAQRQTRQREMANRLERPCLAEGQAGFDRETLGALYEELDRLPEKLRTPVFLFYLEGRTQAQVAAFLGCDQSVVSRRLSKALNLLRQRLECRGMAVVATTLAAWLGYLSTTEASLLPRTGVIDSAARAAVAAVSGAKGGASPAAVALATAVLRPKVSVWWLVVAGVFALGSTGLAFLPGERRSSQDAIPRMDVPARAAATQSRTSRRRAEVSGQVVGPDGDPIPHAAVSVLVQRSWTPARRGGADLVVARGRADAKGRYRLPVPATALDPKPALTDLHPKRQLFVAAHAPGFALTMGTMAIRGDGFSADVRLAALRSVLGRATGPDGRPAPGVRLSVVYLGWFTRDLTQGDNPTPTPDGWPADVTTAPDGSFQFDGVPKDTYVLVQVQDDRYALTTFEFRAGDDVAAISLSPPHLLCGVVEAEGTGAPMAGARISVFAGPKAAFNAHAKEPSNVPIRERYPLLPELSGWANSRGQFRLRLPPGEVYRIFAYPPEGEAYLSHAVTIDWPKGESRQNLRLALASGAIVRGSVRDEGGRGIEGACVALVTSPPPTVPPLLWFKLATYWDEVAYTGANGAFRMVVPNGPAHLRVFGPSSEFRFPNSPTSPTWEEDRLGEWEHTQVSLDQDESGPGDPVRVVLRRQRTLRVQVVGPDGAPVPFGVAYCRSIPNPPPGVVPRAMRVKDGQFDLPGCIPGRTYPVLVFDSKERRGALAEVQVPGPAAPPPTVRVEACGNATVRLVDAASQPIAGCRAFIYLWLNRDRPAEAPASDDQTSPDALLPCCCGNNPVLGLMTDADGRLELRGVLPGPEYGVSFMIADGREIHSPRFRVAPGQGLKLTVVAQSPKETVSPPPSATPE